MTGGARASWTPRGVGEGDVATEVTDGWARACGKNSEKGVRLRAGCGIEPASRLCAREIVTTGLDVCVCVRSTDLTSFEVIRCVIRF